MSAAPDSSPSPAASCDYCGRANPDGLPACVICGKPLIDTPIPVETESPGKSRVLAVCLALMFGPLGLLYVRAWWQAFVLIVLGTPFVLTNTGGLWLPIASRILCAALAYHGATELDENPNPNRDALRLLDAAARLEAGDRAKAIEAYEEIVRLYPGTRAGKEALSNLGTLRKDFPKTA